MRIKKMKVLNFGSLNVDYVYDVPHFVCAGETIASSGRGIYSGGKGLNQSVAAARAGLPVYHAGSVGPDGGILVDTLRQNGVNTDFIKLQDAPSGHTVIQVDPNGQNCIIVFGGTNRMIGKDHIDGVFGGCACGDILLLQNEVNNGAYIIQKAHETGMTVMLNPSPFDEEIRNLPLDLVDYFVLNEIEGAGIAGTEDPEKILETIFSRYPAAQILLTLGMLGSVYYDGNCVYRQAAFPVEAVDTTGAGDTFLGYFTYGIVKGLEPQEILRLASRASAITVTRKGAAGSIPNLEEVLRETF
jgi:ribokinase